MQPFEVVWTEAQVQALLAKVAAIELPPAPAGAGWTMGCDRDFLERFRDHWLNVYDWRAAMADLNRYPQFHARIDDIDIHFVHVRGEAPGARPLIMTHGWPGSHHEFWGVIERLAFPSRRGGRKEDAFDIVLPSLPGYGFSGKPTQPIGPKRIAELWDKLMCEVLGYPEYLAQGGDWGAVVTSQLGLNHAPAVRAIHLNMAALRSPAPAQNDAETAWMARAQGAQMVNGGYATLQVMKPLSIGWATAGNPLGQAAWILERFHDWSDLREGDLESVYGLDALATNIMIYVTTDSFASSVWLYNGVMREGAMGQPFQRCETPTGFAAFPMDGVQPNPPRSRVELIHNLVHWSEPARGGHFAAMEQPTVFVEDILAWAAKVWPVQGAAAE